MLPEESGRDLFESGRDILLRCLLDVRCPEKGGQAVVLRLTCFMIAVLLVLNVVLVCLSVFLHVFFPPIVDLVLAEDGLGTVRFGFGSFLSIFVWPMFVRPQRSMG